MIDTYLDDAKRQAGLASDRALAKILSINNSSLNQYRTGRALPSDAIMLQIAELANIPADQALLDLAMMRSNSEPAKAVLLNLKKRLTTACLAGAVMLSLTSPAPAASPCDQMLHPSGVYYGKYLKRLWRRISIKPVFTGTMAYFASWLVPITESLKKGILQHDATTKTELSRA